jgi:hypothetical protein
MLKRKYLFKDIVVNEKSPTNDFTEDSYIVIDYPSYREKMVIHDKVASNPNDWRLNVEIYESLVFEVKALTVGLLEEVNSFEMLTCLEDGKIITDWLMELAANGFVPKKI